MSKRLLRTLGDGLAEPYGKKVRRIKYTMPPNFSTLENLQPPQLDTKDCADKYGQWDLIKTRNGVRGWVLQKELTAYLMMSDWIPILHRIVVLKQGSNVPLCPTHDSGDLYRCIYLAGPDSLADLVTWIDFFKCEYGWMNFGQGSIVGELRGREFVALSGAESVGVFQENVNVQVWSVWGGMVWRIMIDHDLRTIEVSRESAFVGQFKAIPTVN